MRDILVVKLGGSSASSPDFRRWIEAVEKASGPVVVVPGGGPFANAVRRYQVRMGYDDEAANRMTVLAMEQFALALRSLGRRMATASGLDAVDAVVASGQVAVWMPPLEIMAEPCFSGEEGPNSDTLAAWLAAQLSASRLLLVKQIDLPAEAHVETLVHAGMVDASFVPRLAEGTRVFVAGPADLALAAKRFANGLVPGREVPRDGRLPVAAE